MSDMGRTHGSADGARKILLVDDDAELAQMMSEYLRPEGFAVDAAHDGADPRAAEPAGYDLVVLDVMLPNRSGFEVHKAIRRASSVPVILLTARDGDTDRMVGLELGADDYVPKPLNPRELAARIRAVLRRAGPGRAGRHPRPGCRSAMCGSTPLRAWRCAPAARST